MKVTVRYQKMLEVHPEHPRSGRDRRDDVNTSLKPQSYDHLSTTEIYFNLCLEDVLRQWTAEARTLALHAGSWSILSAGGDGAGALDLCSP